MASTDRGSSQWTSRPQQLFQPLSGSHVTHAVLIQHDAYIALAQRVDRFMLSPFNPDCLCVCVCQPVSGPSCVMPARERRVGGGVGGKDPEKETSFVQRANGQRRLNRLEIWADSGVEVCVRVSRRVFVCVC